MTADAVTEAQAEYEAAIAALKAAMANGRRYIADELARYQTAAMRLREVGGPWLT